MNWRFWRKNKVETPSNTKSKKEDHEHLEKKIYTLLKQQEKSIKSMEQILNNSLKSSDKINSKKINSIIKDGFKNINQKLYDILEKKDKKNILIIQESIKNLNSSLLDVIEQQKKDQISLHQENFLPMEEHLSSISQQQEENAELINRLSRLQYKTGQDLTKMIHTLNNNMQNFSQVTKLGHESMQLTLLENKNHTLINAIIKSIDHIDLILNRMENNTSSEWLSFLSTLQSELIEGLEKTGIKEAPLLGTSFHALFAEAIDSIPAENLLDQNKNYLPYEVIRVLKRCFLTEQGAILRKAQVITLQKQENYISY